LDMAIKHMVCILYFSSPARLTMKVNCLGSRVSTFSSFKFYACSK
jgi:hypothetical protein